MSKTNQFCAILLAALLLLGATALAHEGKLDSDGCHHSASEGYHCH